MRVTKETTSKGEPHLELRGPWRMGALLRFPEENDNLAERKVRVLCRREAGERGRTEGAGKLSI